MARKPKEPTFRGANLLKRFDKVNSERFGGLVCGGIGWRRFRMGKSGASLACCLFDERLIRVSTVMDDKRIPLWYLDFVLYHEMLHLHLGPRQFSPDGYSYPHDLRFQCLEKRHPDYGRAMKFEDHKLDRVLDSHRRWRAWSKTSRSQLRLAAKRNKKK